jgi:putative ABC transport system permease protein
VIRLSGRLRSSLIIGIQGIRARKTRTALSMMSLFLGVLAVVVVQAGAEVARRAELADLELVMGKDGTVQMYLPSSPQSVPIVLDTLHGRADGVASFTNHAIIGEPGVTPINPGGGGFDQPGQGPYTQPGTSYVTCDARGVCTKVEGQSGDSAPPGQAIEVSLTAMTGDVRRFQPFRSVTGRWLDFSSPPSLAPRIVLNKEAAKGFGRYRVPAQLRLTGATADATPRIIGVVDDGGQEPAAYVRSDELLNWVPVANGNDGGLRIMLAPTATELQQTLRARLVAGGTSAGQIHTEPIDARKSIAARLALVQWIFLAMAGLVLLIGVAGILNVGLATVGERVEEFALRRAVGTPRSLLAGIVLAETLLTGLLTAAAAIGVAALGVRLASHVLAGRIPSLADLQFPWQAAVAGIIAGLVAGLLGGLIPAIRAARIPIATVMRA